MGIRLRASVIREVKVEAAQRGLQLNELFEELWDHYQRRKDGRGHGKKSNP